MTRLMLCAVLLTVLSSLGWARELIAEVSDDQLRQGEAFELVITFIGNYSQMSDNITPNLDSLLHDFDVEDGQQTRFTQFEQQGLIQGIKWDYQLTPRYSGKQLIAGIYLGELYANVVLIDPQVGVKGAFVHEPQGAAVIQRDDKHDGRPIWGDKIVFFGWVIVLLMLAFSFAYRQPLYRIIQRLRSHAKYRIQRVKWNRQLRKACLNQQPELVKDLLIKLINVHSPDSTVRSLGSMVRELRDRDIEKAFIAEIKQLDRYLYGNSHSADWTGVALWQRYHNINPFHVYRNKK